MRIGGESRRQPLDIYRNAAAIDSLAAGHALCGADVWHPAQICTLLGALPGLKMLTFERRLREAAISEGLLPGE
jgi:hypothetical protein